MYILYAVQDPIPYEGSGDITILGSFLTEKSALNYANVAFSYENIHIGTEKNYLFGNSSDYGYAYYFGLYFVA